MNPDQHRLHQLLPLINVIDDYGLSVGNVIPLINHQLRVLTPMSDHLSEVKALRQHVKQYVHCAEKRLEETHRVLDYLQEVNAYLESRLSRPS